jgi:hypothetical protein
MTLNATGLGVGGLPSGGMLMTVGSTSSVSATANAYQILSSKGVFNIVTDGSTNAAGTTISYSWANGGQGPLIFRNAAIANVMTLDATGNVGVGVTPVYKLDVAGTVRIGGGVNPSMRLETGTNTGFLDYNNTRLAVHAGSLPIDFVAGNTVKMTLDASGNLSLGQSSSALQSGGTGITLFGTSASEIKFLNSTTGSTASDGTAIVTTGNNFSINNRESGSVSIGTSNTNRLVIEAAGDVTVSTGNVVMATSGKGIDFSATASGSGTMTSELLNDYEEGTFVPTVIGSTVAGVGTYTQQGGFYTKVGNLVTVSVFLGWTAHTGTGDMRFGNLPFTTNSASNSYGAASITFVNNIALLASNVLTLLIPPGQVYIEAYQYPVGGGSTSGVTMDTSGSIMYTATYRV